MKRIAFLLLAIHVTMLSGCKKDGGTNGGTTKIWDINPVTVSVTATDAQGNDLLNPQTPGALEVGKIKALYKGEEYACDEKLAASKAVLPRFYGLKTEKSALGICLLRFGELEGAQSYTNESVTIIWPDGSSDQISFNRVFRWKANGDPEIKEKWFLNGSEVSGKLVKIIK